MKPFNLEAAKRGEKVITRSGKQARIICFDANINTEEAYRLVALVQHLATKAEVLRTFTVKGKLNSNKESDYDLFMAPKTLTTFVVSWVFHGVEQTDIFLHKNNAEECAAARRNNTDCSNVLMHEVILEV